MQYEDRHLEIKKFASLDHAINRGKTWDDREAFVSQSSLRQITSPNVEESQNRHHLDHDAEKPKTEMMLFRFPQIFRVLFQTINFGTFDVSVHVAFPVERGDVKVELESISRSQGVA